MLKRRNTLWTGLTLAVTVMFGVTACSGGSEPSAPVSSAPATQEAATAETPADDDSSSTQACLDLAGPFAEAATKMAAVADGSQDPQAVVDSYSALVDALGAVADSASNDDVRAAAAAAQADMAAVRDGLQQVYVDGDMLGVSELTTATSAMQDSYTALLELCSA